MEDVGVLKWKFGEMVGVGWGWKPVESTEEETEGKKVRMEHMGDSFKMLSSNESS